MGAGFIKNCYITYILLIPGVRKSIRMGALLGKSFHFDIHEEPKLLHFRTKAG